MRRLTADAHDVRLTACGRYASNCPDHDVQSAPAPWVERRRAHGTQHAAQTGIARTKRSVAAGIRMAGRSAESEPEDGRPVLRTILSADSSRVWSAGHDDGRDPNNTRDVERGHHDEPQTSRSRCQRRSERVVAVDVRARRHERRAVMMRATQEIRQVTRRKRRGERQQNLCNQPERTQSSDSSKHHVPVARMHIRSKVRIQKEGHRRRAGGDRTIGAFAQERRALSAIQPGQVKSARQTLLYCRDKSRTFLSPFEASRETAAQGRRGRRRLAAKRDTTLIPTHMSNGPFDRHRFVGPA